MGRRRYISKNTTSHAKSGGVPFPSYKTILKKEKFPIGVATDAAAKKLGAVFFDVFIKIY
jgi:hypothetical protein